MSPRRQKTAFVSILLVVCRTIGRRVTVDAYGNYSQRASAVSIDGKCCGFSCCCYTEYDTIQPGIYTDLLINCSRCTRMEQRTVRSVLASKWQQLLGKAVRDARTRRG